MPRLFGSPVLAPSGDGRLELFIFAIDGSLWHIWQTAWSNGWSGWASPGGEFAEWPAAIARNGDGRLITLAVSGVLEQIEQTSWSNGWSGWTSLGLPPGGMINPPTVTAGADGRLILFASTTGQGGPTHHRLLCGLVAAAGPSQASLTVSCLSWHRPANQRKRLPRLRLPRQRGRGRSCRGCRYRQSPLAACPPP